jgi:hypothetical protein
MGQRDGLVFYMCAGSEANMIYFCATIVVPSINRNLLAPGRSSSIGSEWSSVGYVVLLTCCSWLPDAT